MFTPEEFSSLHSHCRVAPQSLKMTFHLDFLSPRYPKISVNGPERAINAASASSWWRSLILLFTPIRTTNLDPLIPVSSRSLGGSSQLMISHSWTETGFLVNGQVLTGFCSAYSCVPELKWVASGLRVRPPASFGSQIFNPYFQAGPHSHLNINTSQSWTLLEQPTCPGESCRKLDQFEKAAEG